MTLKNDPIKVKSSKKNFNFALIRTPPRAHSSFSRVDFCPFWIITICESVLRVPILILLKDDFLCRFWAPRGGPGGGPPRKSRRPFF